MDCDELLQSLDEPLVLSSLRAIQMNADHRGIVGEMEGFWDFSVLAAQGMALCF